MPTPPVHVSITFPSRLGPTGDMAMAETSAGANGGEIDGWNRSGLNTEDGFTSFSVWRLMNREMRALHFPIYPIQRGFRLLTADIGAIWPQS